MVTALRPDQQTAEPLIPFALRYLEAGASTSVKGGKTATSRQTSEDGEEEADTDWDET